MTAPATLPPYLSELHFQGFDLLSTAVLVVGAGAIIVYANQAAEELLETSRKNLIGQPAGRLCAGDGALNRLIAEARANGPRRQRIELKRLLRDPLPVEAMVSSIGLDPDRSTIELFEVESQLRLTREERQLDLTEANRELLRNLAHEVKNPLGGIRGAAQLLEAQLDGPEEREYTRVIIAEADRLQALVDRLLAPHRMPRVIEAFNIHEVCERVRSVLLAEYPRGLHIVRDYDSSVPEVRGDREQLIQALMNVASNAAQALEARIGAGDAVLELRTRVARHVKIARSHARLALDLHVIDNGPGIEPALQDRIFFPLVSGRAGGTGLGLSLAQSYVHSNRGAIEFESRPGRTVFRILVPL